jgi:predicted Zn finger-like uncharacterized protein
MFTVCPKCALTLVVTAADLRIAQGYVRCGRCSSVFNALARLTDDRHAAESLSEAQQPAVARSESARPAGPTELPAHPEEGGEESHEGPDDQAPHDQAPHDQEPHAGSPQQAEDVSANPEAAAPEHRGSPPASTGAPSTEHSGSGSSISTAEEVIPESALEFDPVTTDVAAVFIEPPPDPAWTAATGTFKAMIARTQVTAAEGTSPEGTSPAGSSHEESTNQDSAPEPSPREAVQPQPSSSAATREPEPSTIARPERSLPARSAPARGPETARSRPTPRHTALHGRPPSAAALRHAPGDLRHDDLTAAVDLIDESVRSERHGGARVRASVWAVATGIASFVLLAQIIHHYRDELAVRVGLNRPLTALYATLGVPLVPHWDLHAYDVRQLGAVADPATAGLITVRASIKNAALQAQPLPLLRVTLQDRFGNRIAARDVAPHSYLPPAVPASSFIGAGQRIDAEMGFVDPGANAVGFEIDACLPQRGGAIACANESATR